MENKFRVVQRGNIYFVEMKVQAVIKRRFWFNKTVMVFKPLNKLGTPIQRISGMNKRTNANVLKTFTTQWNAQAWASKMSKRIVNKDL